MNTKRTFNQIIFPKRGNGAASEATMYLRITVNGLRHGIHNQSRRMNGENPKAKEFNSYLDAVEFRIYEIYKELLDGHVGIFPFSHLKNGLVKQLSQIVL